MEWRGEERRGEERREERRGEEKRGEIQGALRALVQPKNAHRGDVKELSGV